MKIKYCGLSEAGGSVSKGEIILKTGFCSGGGKRIRLSKNSTVKIRRLRHSDAPVPRTE
ncbi:MAG: hypothetical protein JW896_15090 [Deltaproteobacteria bacterium]|nr:hypothetical protein [Deltaproteobacteria bacterium]